MPRTLVSTFWRRNIYIFGALTRHQSLAMFSNNIYLVHSPDTKIEQEYIFADHRRVLWLNLYSADILSYNRQWNYLIQQNRKYVGIRNWLCDKCNVICNFGAGAQQICQVWRRQGLIFTYQADVKLSQLLCKSESNCLQLKLHWSPGQCVEKFITGSIVYKWIGNLEDAINLWPNKVLLCTLILGL